MLSRSSLNVMLCALVETLAETPDGAPSGVLFAALSPALRGSLADYETITMIAKHARLVSESHHVLTLTERGRETFTKLTEYRTARGAA